MVAVTTVRQECPWRLTAGSGTLVIAIGKFPGSDAAKWCWEASPRLMFVTCSRPFGRAARAIQISSNKSLLCFVVYDGGSRSDAEGHARPGPRRRATGEHGNRCANSAHLR